MNYPRDNHPGWRPMGERTETKKRKGKERREKEEKGKKRASNDKRNGSSRGNKGDIRSRIGITAVVLWTFGCHDGNHNSRLSTRYYTCSPPGVISKLNTSVIEADFHMYMYAYVRFRRENAMTPRLGVFSRIFFFFSLVIVR